MFDYNRGIILYSYIEFMVAWLASYPHPAVPI